MRGLLALTVLISTPLSAWADSGPVIVVPSRPDVPITINGRNAAYAVVEGDWGLAKGIHVEPAIYPRPGYDYVAQPVGRYFPIAGHATGYGRREVDTPPRQLPRSESFNRAWSAESNPVAPADIVPANPPPVIVAPQIGTPPPHWQPSPNPRPQHGFHPKAD